MAGFQDPGQGTPPQGPNGPSGPGTPSGGLAQGHPIWKHIETEPMKTGPAVMETARLGTWEGLDSVTRTRYLRAFVVMSLQAATIRNEPQTLGMLSAESYADDEHNAAGATVARTLMLLGPKRPMLIAKGMLTTDGEPAIMTDDSGTGLGPVAIVAAVAVAAAIGFAIGWFGSGANAEKNDRADFRENKTKQLATAQAAAIDLLSKHAERERLAGKPLPFTEEEKRLLGTLEDTQRAIVTERREPLPVPFEGAKSLADLGKSVTGTLEALLPLALVGGAFYLLSRFGGESAPPPHAREGPIALLPPHDTHQTITLTRNKEGVYE